MYTKSIKKSEEIIRLYKEGAQLTEICKLTSSSQPTVKKVLLKSGIDYDQDLSLKRQEQLNQVLVLYKEGKSQLYIEQTLKLTRKTIRELLKTSEVEYRDKSDQHHIRYGTEIDHNAFDELTPEALYWIGMLYSDGHIEDKEASVDLTLHTDDIDHLEKLKVYLKSNRKITSSKNSSCSRLRFNSVRIRNRLKELGFTQNKSVTIYPYKDLKWSRDFWRGVVDGDGGIYYYENAKSPTNHITLCGTLETLFDFIIFCSEKALVKDKYPTKNKGKNLYSVQYYGQDAIKVANLLYKDATIYLDRKYQIYTNYFKKTTI